ncbi:hypothetical protein K469DRAFT_753528 [Zopfia rhizophila CBS 207.26]|uniref:Uncharacterized protein n=1 Tax=Zopfia rhizophila CBS 207.26 TaxID=1314779 RepID=A0A6A6DMV0_9PEZI|nr:hypothetical protein K469DRAFT_753528 [Zopfia rhizophila CBS 207.26]
MRALSVEDIEGICHERPPAEDELFFGDVGVTDGPSATHKRTRPSSVYTIISPTAVPDLTWEPELEDPRSAKRRRPAERQAESLILDPIPTPRSMPLPAPSGPDSRTGARNEPSPGPLDTDSKGDGAGSPVLPLNDLLDVENGCDGAHGRGTGEELLHSSR